MADPKRGRGPDRDPDDDNAADKGKRGDQGKTQQTKDGGKKSHTDYDKTDASIAAEKRTTAFRTEREALEEESKLRSAQLKDAKEKQEHEAEMRKLGIEVIKSVDNNTRTSIETGGDAVTMKQLADQIAALNAELLRNKGEATDASSVEIARTIVSSPQVQEGAMGRINGWRKRWPRLSGFLAGAAGGMAVRGAAKLGIISAFGASLPATIAAGAVGGGLWEGIKAARREAVTYQSTEILTRFRNIGNEDYLQKAAMLAELEQLMQQEKLGGNEADFQVLRTTLMSARKEMQVLIDGKDGKFVDFTDRDKVNYLLNLSKGIRGGIENTTRGEEARRLMTDIGATLENKRDYWSIFGKGKRARVGKAILRGAAYGALGGAIGGAVVNYGSSFISSWFGGGGAGTAVSSAETGLGSGNIVNKVTEFRPKISDHFTEPVGAKGVTGAGRDAIHHYLSEQSHISPDAHLNIDMDIEKLVYAEDYLKDQALRDGFGNAPEIRWTPDQIHEAVTRAGIIGKDAVLTGRGEQHIAELLQTKAHFLSNATREYMLTLDDVPPEGITRDVITKDVFMKISAGAFPAVAEAGSENAWSASDVAWMTPVLAAIITSEVLSERDRRLNKNRDEGYYTESNAVVLKTEAQTNATATNEGTEGGDDSDTTSQEGSSTTTSNANEGATTTATTTAETTAATTTTTSETTTEPAAAETEEKKEPQTEAQIVELLNETFPDIEITFESEYKTKKDFKKLKAVSDLLVSKADEIKASDMKNLFISKDFDYPYGTMSDFFLGTESTIDEIRDQLDQYINPLEESIEPKETTKEFMGNILERLDNEFPGMKVEYNFGAELAKANQTKITLLADSLIAHKSEVMDAELKVMNFTDAGGTKVEKIKKKRTLQIDIGESIDVLQAKVTEAKVDKKDTVDYTDYEAILAKAEEPLKKHFGNNFKFNLVDEEGTPESLKKFFTAKIVTSLDKNSKMLESIGERMHKAGINNIYIFKVTPAPSARTRGQDSLFLDLREKVEDNKKDIEGEVEYLEQKQGLTAEAIKIFGLEKLKPEEVSKNKDVNAWINLMNPSKTGPLWNAFDNEADAEKLQAALRKQTSWKRGAFYTFKNWKVVRDEMEALIVSFNKTKSSNMLALINQLDQLTPQLRDKIIKKNRAEGSKFEKNKLELDIQTRAEKLVDQNLVTTETKQSIDKLFTDPAPDNDAKRMILEGVYVDLYKLIYTNEISSLDATIKEYNKKALAALIEYISKMDNIAGKVRVEESVPPLLPTDEARAIFQEVKNSRR